MGLGKKLAENKGQVVVWVVLISVVGLTLGLSIASRSMSNIQQSSELEESSRAFSAAEAGIEEALYSLEETGAAESQLTPAPLSEGESEYAYEVSAGGGGSEFVLAATLEKDQVAQVDCSNMSGRVEVFWVRDGSGEDQDGGNRASLLLTFISQEDAVSGVYEVKREAFNPAEDTGRDNGFAAADASGAPYTVGGIDFAESTGWIDLPGTAGKEKILRIHAFYNGVANTVGLRAETDQFPSQYHTITSTGTAGETERTVQATRSQPSLPLFFDYTLFNLSTTSLSK